ncbi:MAG: glycoside hydrolase family 5 protein [Chitinispirillaceae bacterium]
MSRTNVLTGLMTATPILALLLMMCSADVSDIPTAPELNRSDWEIHRQNALLGNCMNLGNALEAPTEGEWGPVLQEEYFSHVKSLGFDAVRVPVRWSAHASSAAPYKIDETFFRRVEWAVDQALENNLRVIINIHHYEELMNDPAGEKDKFLSLWKQISERFRLTGPELYFELCNEPMDALTPELWNTYAQEALDVVRATNPYRSVLIGPGMWNSVDGLTSLVMPQDSFLIFTFHYYKPDKFTHQGASWVNGSDSWIGTKWRASRSDTSMIQKHFEKVETWSKDKGVPVFLGEFGAFDAADTVSRVLYTSYVAKEALKRGWSHAYWKYNFDFGIYEDSTNTTREYLVDALLIPEETFETYYELAKSDTHTVDPGSAQFIVLDDFEDTLDFQNNLAVPYMDQKNVAGDSARCWWSVWYNDSSSILDYQGNRIHTYLETDIDGKEPNFENLIGDWGLNGRGLHAKGKLAGGSYPFLGLGTIFTGEYNVEWTDLSELTAVTFWAKGVGEMRVEFTSDTVENGYPEGENWGHFGADFSLTEEWKYYVVTVDDLKAKDYSQAFIDGLTWEDAMEKVCYMSFINDQSYGKVVNDSVAIYLDDIRLYGVTYETFGLQSPQ